ncbi:MAG TPA: hypothetical protein VND64_32285 [Pirellulales bacterium]|nr:hypothetical protein [Pirellulales bacterium]
MPTYESRENKTAFTVKVAWTDGEGGEIRPQALVHLPTLDRDTDMFPELGQPLTTRQQQTIDKLAKEIVGKIESRW